jgi:hypothetical protein
MHPFPPHSAPTHQERVPGAYFGRSNTQHVSEPRTFFEPTLQEPELESAALNGDRDTRSRNRTGAHASLEECLRTRELSAPEKRTHVLCDGSRRHVNVLAHPVLIRIVTRVASATIHNEMAAGTRTRERRRPLVDPIAIGISQDDQRDVPMRHIRRRARRPLYGSP